MRTYCYWMLILLFTAVSFFSCTKEKEGADRIILDAQVLPYSDTLRGAISENTLLTNDHPWHLKGIVYVNNEASLTIEPGTTIKLIPDTELLQGHKKAMSGLVITRGSTIQAKGTAYAPIQIAIADSTVTDSWYGVIILGKAPVSKPNPVFIPFVMASNAGMSYGGKLPNDSSGVLEYVEISGQLHLLGIGSKTIIRQVSIPEIFKSHEPQLNIRPLQLSNY